MFTEIRGGGEGNYNDIGNQVGVRWVEKTRKIDADQVVAAIDLLP
jgi:hypothetical protein